MTYKRSKYENKGIVPTKMELELEQTQQGIHSEDGNIDRANIKQALGLHKDGDADASFFNFYEHHAVDQLLLKSIHYDSFKQSLEQVCTSESELDELDEPEDKGIDYEENFSHVARLEAIRILLAYAAYMGFVVYHMDVKNAFLNGKISEEVYVQQPPEFKSSEFTNYVCKLEKVVYGQKQAPIAWYETLSTFLIQHKFVRVKCLMLPSNNLGPDELKVSQRNSKPRSLVSKRIKSTNKLVILKGNIELHFIPTDLQLAAIFNTHLAEPRFTRLVAELGMLNIEKHVSDKKKGFK
ncbi:retrovirus-related pol polyprotein from transposon TNT 1-94 [Tanacetum coccineum]